MSLDFRRDGSSNPGRLVLNAREIHLLTYVVELCCFPQELRGLGNKEGVRDRVVGVANTLLFHHPLKDHRPSWQRQREPRLPSSEEIFTGRQRAREMLRGYLEEQLAV